MSTFGVGTFLILYIYIHKNNNNNNLIIALKNCYHHVCPTFETAIRFVLAGSFDFSSVLTYVLVALLWRRIIMCFFFSFFVATAIFVVWFGKNTLEKFRPVYVICLKSLCSKVWTYHINVQGVPAEVKRLGKCRIKFSSFFSSSYTPPHQLIQIL